MIGLRYFTAKAQYSMFERSIGLRIFSKIQFLQGYFNTQAAAVQSATARIATGGAAEQAATQDPWTEKISSKGSQVEADFMIPEWHNNPNPNAKYDIHDIGMDVPEVFREHRHTYSAKPTDINAYRKQITYRCGHIGTKELEIVLRDWLELNSQKMTYAELEQFDDEIIGIENP